MKNNKNLLAVGSIIWLSGYSPEITKQPAQVSSHTRVNKSLDDCDRLGEVKAEYEVNKDLDQWDNKIQAQAELKQRAYDEYRANNLVFIGTHYVKGGFWQTDMIYSRGLAYECD